MKKGSTLFLKLVLILMGVVVLTWLVVFPQTEGRAANLDLISIYVNPVIIYMYIGSIPFFVALYQAFKLLGYIEQNKAFSQLSVKALKNIKYCAIAIIGFLAVAIVSLSAFANKEDDPAGPIMLGMLTIFTSAVIATAAGVFQRLVQNGSEMKSENDLTV